MKRKPISLKWGLMTAILFCWIAAVLVVLYIGGLLLDYNFSRNLQETLSSNAENMLEQVGIRLTDSMEASKEVSYDGVVRSAYRRLKSDGNNTAFYRTVSEYLTDTFSRDAKFKAVFLSFRDSEVTSRLYVINRKTNSYHILQDFLTEVKPGVLSAMQDADTRIVFLVYDGELYLCRNLMDSDFRPYATLTMLCDAGTLFQSLQPLEGMTETVIGLDGLRLQLTDDFRLIPLEDGTTAENMQKYASTVGEHELALYVGQTEFDLATLPGLKPAVLVALLLVLPILAVMIAVFYRTVTEPMQTLTDASQRVRDGERGYIIEASANTSEFNQLYQHFNAMSVELKSQFERSQLEQQALQQAKIKALQSQINPHFLNNTLEVINWEARMAGNDNVSEMIDALSTMLEAALDRDGTGVTVLQKELAHVDAYLTIIHKRIGDRFQYTFSIDEDLLNCRVPKLILQPLAENAVEHGITPRKGGQMNIRATRKGNELCLEVSHEGHLTEADRRNIDEILAAADPRELSGTKGRVGLKNVTARLKLLYGDKSRICVTETENGIICARVTLPL